MSVETEKPQQKHGIFAKEWTKWASLCALVLALGMLFLPLIEQCVKVDGVKIYTLIYLWDVFKLMGEEGMNATGVTAIFAIVLMLCAIPLVLLGKKKNSFPVAASLCLFIAAALMFLMPSIYLDQVGCRSADINLGLSFGFAFSVISAVFALSYSYQKMPMTIRDMAEDAVLVATAFALNFVKIPMGATGGSINFQMLPLLIIALRHGPLQALISGGIVFGVLTCFTDGYGFATFPFDYLIGFGSVAVLGFFKDLIMKKEDYNLQGEIFIAVGVIGAGLVRMIGSTASSMIFYGYGLVDALAYNVLYIPASAGAALVVLMALYGPLLKLNKRFPAVEEANETEITTVAQ